MKCPECGSSSFKTERRLDGDSSCMQRGCGYTSKTSYWVKFNSEEYNKAMRTEIETLRSEKADTMTELEIDRLCSIQSRWVSFKYTGQDDYDIKWILKKVSGVDPNMHPDLFREKIKNAATLSQRVEGTDAAAGTENKKT